MIEHICEQCGGAYYTIHKKSRFCKKECYGKWLSLHKSGENHSQYGKPKSQETKSKISASTSKSVKKECEYCGKSFLVRPSYILLNRGRYCSKTCVDKSKTRLIESTCGYCGNKFVQKPSILKLGRGKYCSRSCYNNYRNNIKKEHICEICGDAFKVTNYTINTNRGKVCSLKCRYEHQKIPRTLIICKQCGTHFTRLPSYQSKEKFCSRKCYIAYTVKDHHPKWKGGTSCLPYCFKFNQRRRKAVRIFFEYFCICCGKHVTENIIKRGQVEHNVHHVDHDKEQGCNGKPFNLVPLCHECHGREIHHEQEYKDYINKTLEDGFKWGIWSREQYEREVMYPE